jgi:dolichyl-phosphate-mannose-protein mannosyltransferase
VTPGPPRWLGRTAFLALAALLVFPVHVSYQNPDQDVPVVLSLLELVRGGWEPWTLHYPSALTNLLRAGWTAGLAGARVAGLHADPLDVVAAWYHDPAAFRLVPRAFAMACGIVSLAAVARLAALVGDRWAGLFAAVLLGTSVMFVREHHHGMWDAPASTAVIASLAACGRYVVRPRLPTIVAAGALAGLAIAFKYNAAVVLVGPILAAAVVPGTPRARAGAAVLALGASLAAVLVASPALLLEPARVAIHFHRHADLYRNLRRTRQTAPVPYALADVLRNGLGVPLGACALLGIAIAARRRERPLAPLVGFAAAYGVVTWRYPIALNRYALPLAPAAAVLGAYGLHRTLPFRWRAAAVAVLVAVGLPACVEYVTLLAREDTRVASARWLETHVRPDARVFLPTDIGGVVYVGPDLQRPFEPFEGLTLPADRLAALLDRIGPPFPRTWRFIGPGVMGDAAARDRDPAGWANGIVVTSELGAYPFRPYDTAPDAIRFLERHAVLVQDYPIERRPAARVYEQVDLNYAPFRGAATLLRPGPRIRIWYVPPHGGDGDASPFLQRSFSGRDRRLLGDGNPAVRSRTAERLPAPCARRRSAP